MTLLSPISMLAGSMFVTLATLSVWRRVDPRIHALRAAVFCFLWILITTAYTLTFGIAGRLDAPSIGIVSTAGSILLLMFFREEYRQLLNRLTSLNPGNALRGSSLNSIVIPLALLQIFRALFHVLYIPPYDDDVLIYHLPNLAEWVQHGSIQVAQAPSAMTWFPMTYEVLETWFALFFHHDLLIGLAGIAYALLGVFSVYELSRALGTRPAVSRLSALLFSFTPVFSIRMTTGDAELPVASLFLFSAALGVRLFSFERDTNTSRSSLFWLLVASVLLGTGIKPTFMMLAPGLLIPTVLWGMHSLRNRKISLPLLRSPVGMLRRKPLPMGIVLAAALLTGSFFYVRNWVVQGNPLYPAPIQVGETHIFPNWVPAEDGGLIQDARISPGLMVLNFRKAAARILDREGQFVPALPHQSGWGWFSFCCGIPSLLIGLVISRKLRAVAGAFGLSLATLFASVSADPWFMRFTAWFPALFALSFGILLSWLGKSPWSKPPLVLGLITTLLNYIGGFSGGHWGKDDLARMIGTPVFQRSTVGLMEKCEPEYAQALARIPEGAAFGYSMPPIDYVSPLYGSNFSRKPFLVELSNEDVVAALHRNNARYLFVTRAFGDDKQALDSLVAENRLIHENGFLYRLDTHLDTKAEPGHE